MQTVEDDLVGLEIISDGIEIKDRLHHLGVVVERVADLDGKVARHALDGVGGSPGLGEVAIQI